MTPMGFMVDGTGGIKAKHEQSDGLLSELVEQLRELFAHDYRMSVSSLFSIFLFCLKQKSCVFLA